MLYPGTVVLAAGDSHRVGVIVDVNPSSALWTPDDRDGGQVVNYGVRWEPLLQGEVERVGPIGLRPAGDL